MSGSEIHTLESINNNECVHDVAIIKSEDELSDSGSSEIQISDDGDSNPTNKHKAFAPSMPSAEVNHEDAFAEKCLVSACREGNLQLVKKLLTTETLSSGCLHHAAANNQWRTCEYLISRGSNVNEMLAPVNATPLLWAARHGHVYIVKLLLDNGANPKIIDNSGFGLLHLAVHSSNVLMVSYAVHLKINVNLPDFGKRTPLHWAVVQGDHLSVEVLLKAGASTNIKDGEGVLPLQLASYNSQSMLIVALLLQFGAEPMGIPIDLSDPPQAWSEGCEFAGRLPNGSAIKSRFIWPELAKFITSVVPSAVLSLVLSLPYITGSSWIALPLALLIFWLAKRLVERCVLPYRWPGKKAIMQSTFLAGIFVAVFANIAYYWFSRMAKIMFSQQPLKSLILVITLAGLTISYLATLMLDPGILEPKSIVLRLKSMNELLDRGLFDSNHICVHTSVTIPERAHYDIYLDRVVCKYDHYCPWSYNAIGIRNHRPFVVFLLLLSYGIPLVGIQYYDYCQQFGSTSYGNWLSFFTILQSLWIYILLVVQLSQIARGVTSYELAHTEEALLYKTDPIKAFSSLPTDHPMASEILGDATSASLLLKHANSQGGCKAHSHKYPLWMRLTGMSQVQSVIKLLRRKSHANRYDFGVVQNCIDFSRSGGKLFTPNSTIARLGGKSIDYSSMDKLPSISTN